MATILTVGLTGDVGAGKSTISRVWREMGALTVDADELAKRQWDAPEVRRAAEERWGAGFFAGDKREIYSKIAAKIFNDAEEYKFASKIIHKAVYEEILRVAGTNEGWLVLEIPLLFESGHYDWLDYIVYAAAPREKRIERNACRGWDENEMARREAWFMSRDEKISRSDFVLENDGTLEEWETKGRELGRLFLDRMARGGDKLRRHLSAEKRKS